MALKMAIANLKGGVGKSTATLFLAEALAHFHDLRVLVVDLDPQANTSFMLLSREGVDRAEALGKTLPNFLLDLAPGGNINPDGYLMTMVSDVEELFARGKRGRVDLFPSIPRMWFVEMVLEKRLYLEHLEPAEELKRAVDSQLAPLNSWYDLIIFDCPPGFSALTRAGLLSADVIISPTIADAVSVRSLADFVEIGLGDVLKVKNRVTHYVMISKYRAQSDDKVEAARLKKTYDVPEPYIKYSVEMTRATERIRANSRRRFGDKYGGLAPDIRALADTAYRYIIKR